MLAVFCVAALSSQGETNDFVVDESETRITVSGIVAGLTVQEQAAGSLSASAKGTLRIETQAQTIRFVGGSLLDFVTNGSWSPLPDGGDGTAPGDFGAKASGLIGNGEAALRDIEFDVVSDVLAVDSQGRFDGRQLVFAFPPDASSVLSYRIRSFLGVFSGVQELKGLSTNQIASSVIEDSDAENQILRISMDANLLFSLVAEDDSIMNLKGQIVARRSISPVFRILEIGILAEPSSPRIQITWSSKTGEVFRVQGSVDLRTWETLTSDIQASGTVTSWNGPMNSPCQFYRVMRLGGGA
ncbi:MAG TPA: hypothetical protein P5186_18725 [Candidatus Paceibacterota bacterium]|nr:hypothetical protein [Candidatus Paceibacterota bacterium]HRZ99438.1 hypothetical protein [Candidatus Paceibacterota bacterium]